MAVYYLDPIGGNNSNDGTSFANRRKSYPSSASNAFQDGDEVRIIKSPDYTSLGNATWKAKPKGTFYDESNAAKISSCTAVKGTTTTINCPSVHGLSTGDLVEIQYNSNVDNKKLTVIPEGHKGEIIGFRKLDKSKNPIKQLISWDIMKRL